MEELRKGLSFDDVLLVPTYSTVDSRSDVDISTEIVPGVSAETPMVSSPMDTVTGTDLARELSEHGGYGILHRFTDKDSRLEMVKEVSDGGVGAAVGINEPASISSDLEEAGASSICVDTAHGHLEKCLGAIIDINRLVDIPIVAGNVATQDAARDLLMAGADGIRVGVGAGSACTTRQMSGVGVPQLTAVSEVRKAVNAHDKPATVMADGGICKPGDAVKALMAGADCVMLGRVFAETEVSLSEGEYRGMASESAQEDNYEEASSVEGESFEISQRTMAEVMKEYTDGIRSGLSYCGGSTIPEARVRSEFIEVTGNTVGRNGAYGNRKI